MLIHRRAIRSQAGLGIGVGDFDTDEETDTTSTEEEDEDEIGELPAAEEEEEERKKRARIGNRRRNSVSSETVRHDEIQKEFPVHAKTPEQEMSIFNILSQSILLKHLAAGPAQIITKAMFKKDVAAGEVVMKQNDEGDNFYIIDDGALLALQWRRFVCSNELNLTQTAGIADIYVAGLDPLTPEDADGPATSEYGGRVQIVKQGDSFGELALMYNAKRAATVVARTDLGLWAVDRTTFRTLVMGVAMAKRSKHSSYLEGVELLSTLTQAERESVIDNMEEETFDEGEAVVTQGEVGSKFFIVTEGDLVVTQVPEGSEESKEVGRLKEGSYFGEIALLTNQQRLATVTAVSKVQCVTIERKVFARVMGPLRDLLRRNMELYNSYISLNL